MATTFDNLDDYLRAVRRVEARRLAEPKAVTLTETDKQVAKATGVSEERALASKRALAEQTAARSSQGKADLKELQENGIGTSLLTGNGFKKEESSD